MPRQVLIIRGDRLGAAEVCELTDTLVVQQDVAGLDVSVHIAVGMQVLEALQDLFRVVDH